MGQTPHPSEKNPDWHPDNSKVSKVQQVFLVKHYMSHTPYNAFVHYEDAVEYRKSRPNPSEYSIKRVAVHGALPHREDGERARLRTMYPKNYDY